GAVVVGDGLAPHGPGRQGELRHHPDELTRAARDQLDLREAFEARQAPGPARAGQRTGAAFSLFVTRHDTILSAPTSAWKPYRAAPAVTARFGGDRARGASGGALDGGG